MDVSALLVINLTQFYSTGITVWLGLISNSIVIVKNAKTEIIGHLYTTCDDEVYIPGYGWHVMNTLSFT